MVGGGKWNKEEASKHLRIFLAIIDTGAISNEVMNELKPEQIVVAELIPAVRGRKAEQGSGDDAKSPTKF